MHNWIRYVSTKKSSPKRRLSAQVLSLTWFPLTFLIFSKKNSTVMCQISVTLMSWDGWWVELDLFTTQFSHKVLLKGYDITNCIFLKHTRVGTQVNSVVSIICRKILALPDFQTFLQPWSWTMSWVGCLKFGHSEKDTKFEKSST